MLIFIVTSPNTVYEKYNLVTRVSKRPGRLPSGDPSSFGCPSAPKKITVTYTRTNNDEKKIKKKRKYYGVLS